MGETYWRFGVETMGEVVNFQNHRMAALNYGDVIVREPTCDEIAEEYSVEEAALDLKVSEHLYKNRTEELTADILNAWEELLITMHPNYIAELKQRMNEIENRAYSQDPEAS